MQRPLKKKQGEERQQLVLIGLSLLLTSQFEQFLRSDTLPLTNQHFIFDDLEVNRFNRGISLLSALLRFLQVENQVRLQKLRS